MNSLSVSQKRAIRHLFSHNCTLSLSLMLINFIPGYLCLSSLTTFFSMSSLLFCYLCSRRSFTRTSYSMNTIHFFCPHVHMECYRRAHNNRARSMMGLFNVSLLSNVPLSSNMYLSFSPRSLSSREFLYPFYLIILFIYRFSLCLSCFLPSFLYFIFLFIISALSYYVLCFVSVYPLFMSLVCLSFICVCLTGCFLQASS